MFPGSRRGAAEVMAGPAPGGCERLCRMGKDRPLVPFGGRTAHLFHCRAAAPAQGDKRDARADRRRSALLSGALVASVCRPFLLKRCPSPVDVGDGHGDGGMADASERFDRDNGSAKWMHSPRSGLVTQVSPWSASDRCAGRAVFSNGLHNRRAFILLAEHAVKEAVRAHRPVIALVADVDDLKAINDTWGHAEGDRALQQVADALQGSCREADIVGRLSGDEFAILLAETHDLDGLERRVRDRLARAARGLAYPLCLSIGVASCEPGHPHDCYLPDLLHRADQAMYADKTRHRRPTPSTDRSHRTTMDRHERHDHRHRDARSGGPENAPPH